MNQQTITNVVYIVLTAGVLVLQHFGYIPSDLSTGIVGLLGLHAGTVNASNKVPVMTVTPSNGQMISNSTPERG